MRHPEVTVEIALQPGRIFLQRGVTTGHTVETALQISLHLAQRGGMRHLASIVAGERIIGILPSLVARAGRDGRIPMIRSPATMEARWRIPPRCARCRLICSAVSTVCPVVTPR